MTLRGSSPLARGLPTPENGPAPAGRIIPARAGFTAADSTHVWAWWDHPRSRGVYSRATRPNRKPGGSSPLARGLPRQYPREVGESRIIPARAGFTLAICATVIGNLDHPRSRGVYRYRRFQPSKAVGSSPLARGLLEFADLSQERSRIIPARAGFTMWSGTNRMRRADHPRSRGVYSSCTGGEITRAGSSPLARGLLPLRQDHRHPRRIIPARAGFTSQPNPVGLTTKDHPRSRGVYRTWGGSSMCAIGSSPLARGLPPDPLRVDQPAGIIPARAGFTHRRRHDRRSRQDHPRSRGVYPPVTCTPLVSRGSSPLARGLPLTRYPISFSSGIIPARAGFTSIRAATMGDIKDHPRSRGVYACGSLVSQRTRSLPDPRHLHCRPRARSAGSP